VEDKGSQSKVLLRETVCVCVCVRERENDRTGLVEWEEECLPVKAVPVPRCVPSVDACYNRRTSTLLV
jgi:hypothetical protein